MSLDISLVVPVFNEEKILAESIRNFAAFFGKNKKIGQYEIIIAENGSNDGTYQIAQKLTRIYKKVKVVRVGEKSLGKALRLGIQKAVFPYVYFNAADNPFGFKDIEQFLEKIPSFDLIFASKNHPESVYRSKLTRILASKGLSFLIRALFGVPLTDTQGTFMGRRAKLVRILPSCTAGGAFFQSQLAIYSVRGKLKVSEVPVHFHAQGRKSNFSLVRDGFTLLGDLVREGITGT